MTIETPATDPSVVTTVVVPPRPVRTVAVWDLVLTIVFLLGNVGLAIVASFMGVMLVFMSDSCGASTTCDTNQIGLGFTVASVGVWIPVVLALIVAVLLLVLRRRAFYVALIGGALVIAIWFGGLALVLGAISPTPAL